MRVSEIMSTSLTTVGPEDTLAEAATLMGEHRVGSVLVREGDDVLVGIVTERDFVRAMSEAHDAAGRPVIEWMTKNPTTISPDDEVSEALRVMVEGGFRHLPVTNQEHLVGIVSMRDLATALST